MFPVIATLPFALGPETRLLDRDAERHSAIDRRRRGCVTRLQERPEDEEHYDTTRQ
jgi:hypothetical protein